MSEIMDNFALNVRARTKESFEHAMAVAFAASLGGKASHWCEHPEYGLILFWNADGHDEFDKKPIVPFPHALDCKAATSFVWDWLSKVDRKKFKLGSWDIHYDDGDVQNEHAWRIYVEDWGHIGESHYAVAAILPVWAWLGK